MQKIISIVKAVSDVEKNQYSIVFNSSDIRVELYDEDLEYPKGTFFITMPIPEATELRYAVVPCRLHDAELQAE